MRALFRFNAVPMVSRRLAGESARRAAFHACSSPPQKSHQHPPDDLRPAAISTQENTNRAETFSSLDVLGSIPPPPSAVEATYPDGFLLNNGVQIHDGVMLLNNEVFRWLPALKGGLEENKAKTGGMLELTEEAWGLLDVVYPKPELLIIGTGSKTLMISPKTRTRISELGIRLDVMSTHSAAAQYNLLATERGGSQIAAAMLVGGFGK